MKIPTVDSLDFQIQYLNFLTQFDHLPMSIVDRRGPDRVDDEDLIHGMPARDFYRAVRGAMGMQVVS